MCTGVQSEVIEDEGEGEKIERGKLLVNLMYLWYMYLGSFPSWLVCYTRFPCTCMHTKPYMHIGL